MSSSHAHSHQNKPRPPLTQCQPSGPRPQVTQMFITMAVALQSHQNSTDWATHDHGQQNGPRPPVKRIVNRVGYALQSRPLSAERASLASHTHFHQNDHDLKERQLSSDWATPSSHTNVQQNGSRPQVTPIVNRMGLALKSHQRLKERAAP